MMMNSYLYVHMQHMELISNMSEQCVYASSVIIVYKGNILDIG
jgi:hypothetical protein